MVELMKKKKKIRKFENGGARETKLVADGVIIAEKYF